MNIKASVAVTILLSAGLIPGQLLAESTFDKGVESRRLQEGDGKQGINHEVELGSSKEAEVASVDELCRKVGRKLGSVSTADCLAAKLETDGGHSNNGLPMAWVEFPPLAARKPEGRVLVLGGIHGDEY